uniref:(Fe-S)-binding protein n=1 Tax=Desulfatirhabdium butyrativorans TaxID=340467 RepID=A0A7C4RT98_9BACT
MYHPRYLIDVLAENVRLTRNPFGIPKPLVNRWHIGMGLPKSAPAMVITGLMYQFMPYIETSTRYLSRFEDTRWEDALRYARWVPGTVSGMGLWSMTPRRDVRGADLPLRRIARILQRCGVDFGYDPELDEYSGVLLYDLGAQDAFLAHARFVADKLRSAGVRRILTVDPHTTYTLKVLYSKVLGMEFDVSPWFEAIDPASVPLVVSQQADRESLSAVTIHDPCFYGRYLEMADAPRRLLGRIGIECADVRNCKHFTSCCGGPAESLSPKLSGEIVRRRVAELQATGKPIVVMCPICMGQLRKVGAVVQDLSEVVAGRMLS